MNWSGISAKSNLGKILRFPLRFLPAQTYMPILQGRLKGKRWVVGSSNHGCWLGSYEFDKQIVFENTITQGSLVFDLGGNVGFYTLLSSELVGPSGKVFVFEPMPRNIYYLREHLRLNHIKNVTVIEAAVSDEDGIILFDEGTNNSTGHISSNGILEVQTVSLDNLVLNRKIPVPNYMKIDIEGAEYSALKGARSILEEAHPTIFLATHGSDMHQKCCHLLESLGYRLRSIDGIDLERSTEILATYEVN